jgi:hypothetical protein
MRLYDNNLAAKYIPISKTVVAHVGAQNTLWVKLFEKGYAALFAGGAYSGLDDITGNQHGMAHNVFRAILGTAMAFFNCSKNDDDFVKLMTLVKGSNSPKIYAQVKDAVFEGKQDLVDGWKNWYTREKYQGWEQLVRASQVYKQVDFQAFLDGPGKDMPINVRDAVLCWVNLEYILPGRRGSGMYTQAQRHVFAQVRAALATNKPVAAGTYKSVAKRDKIIGASLAGEGKARSGLVGGHAYAVLDTKEEDGLFWVQLRNPWGSWDVKYVPDEHTDGPKKGRPYLRPVADEGAEIFWPELSDFTKHFLTVSVGSEVEFKVNV